MNPEWTVLAVADDIKTQLTVGAFNILLNDSKTHYTVQEYINSWLRHQAESAMTEELASLSDSMGKHNKLAKQLMGYIEDLIFLER